MEKDIDGLEYFFKIDLDIKKVLSNSRPNLYDADPVEEDKKLRIALENIKTMFYYMTKVFFFGLYDHIVEKIDVIEKEIDNANFNVNKLINVYEEYFIKMDGEVQNLLEKYVKGYAMGGDPFPAMYACKSINDILHILHFLIMNDENILQSMNILEQKMNDNNYPIVLYGKENEVSKDIYEELTEDVDCGYTDIVGFKNHTLMMIRDRGHALTLDIQDEGDNVRVNYFIPKIINAKMVNDLPGVNKIPLDSKGNDATSGEFVVKKNKIGKVVNEFIKQVPTDKDSPTWSNTSFIR